LELVAWRTLTIPRTSRLILRTNKKWHGAECDVPL
jgi:hypothetical protein